MILEKYRTRKGLMLRALDNKDLFEHCAGGTSIRSHKEKKIIKLLMWHDVGIIKIERHSSV